MKYTIHADGICEPNPGLGAWAYIVYDENGDEIASQKQFRGEGQTNNTMEYQAVIEALVWAHERDTDEITILTDSQLVVNQVNGLWQVKAEKLMSWCDNAKDLMEPHVTLAWVKGVDNKADVLTRQAYQSGTGIWPEPRTKK